MNIYLAEIDAYDPGSSSVITYRVATDAWINPATGDIYEPRIKALPIFSRSIRSSLVGGRSDVGYGEMQLLNGDNALDAMQGDYFDGRTFTLLYGDPAGAYASFTTLMRCKVQTVVPEGETFSVRLRDRSPELERVFSSAVYGGTNTLPNGVDGTPDDIKGQYRPYVFGHIAQLQPVIVNTSLLIYEISAAQCDYVVNVFDAGSYLGRGADYASLAEMQATQPAAGSFRPLYTSTGTYVRLGSTPYGQLTAAVFEKWVHTQVSAAGILSRIISSLGWVAGADYVAADLTTLDQRCCGPLGLMVNQGESIASLIDRIAQTVGAWWGFDALSRFRIARMEAPSGSVGTLTDAQLGSPQGQANEDEIPWRITIPSDWNYAVQGKSQLAGTVQANLARVAWIESESRDQKAESSTVKTARLTATEQHHSGYFAAISQAQTEATRRMALLGTRRDSATAKLFDYQSYNGSIDIGSTVTISTSEIGYSTPRDMIVVGMEIDYDADAANIELWG